MKFERRFVKWDGELGPWIHLYLEIKPLIIASFLLPNFHLPQLSSKHNPHERH